MSTARAAFFAVAGASIFSGLLTDSGLTLAQARDEILGGTQFASAEVVYRRAHDRGEIDLERVPAAALTMPFDLVRHDLLMGLAPLEPARLQSIVEELFLPLVRDRRDSAG